MRPTRGRGGPLAGHLRPRRLLHLRKGFSTRTESVTSWRRQAQRLGQPEHGRVGRRDPVVRRELEPALLAGELVDAGVQGIQAGVPQVATVDHGPRRRHRLGERPHQHARRERPLQQGQDRQPLGAQVPYLSSTSACRWAGTARRRRRPAGVCRGRPTRPRARCRRWRPRGCRAAPPWGRRPGRPAGAHRAAGAPAAPADQPAGEPAGERPAEPFAAAEGDVQPPGEQRLERRAEAAVEAGDQLGLGRRRAASSTRVGVCPSASRSTSSGRSTSGPWSSWRVWSWRASSSRRTSSRWPSGVSATRRVVRVNRRTPAAAPARRCRG